MEHIPGYDEWKTTPPEQGPATYCDCCGCEVYEGDYIYTIDRLPISLRDNIWKKNLVQK